MTSEPLETQLEKWKKVLLAFSGAAFTLLVTALVDLPATAAFYREANNMPLMGWWGVWLVLLLGSLTPGITLLVGRGWRTLPPAQRLNTAFGFLAVGWTCLLAFSIQTAPLAFGALLHFIVWSLGAGLLIAYLLTRRRAQVNPELFP